MQATLRLIGVRNLEEVHRALESAGVVNSGRGYIDEIIGIVKEARRLYLLDLSAVGGIRVEADRIDDL